MDAGKRHIVKGCLAALTGDNWRRHFNLRREGLPQSFIAVGATLPLFLICALAASKNMAAENLIPVPALLIILILFTATFPIMAYLLCMLMNKMDVFRPWVIVRNWTYLLMIAMMALSLGLSLIGLPYAIASSLALIAYIGTLLMDIRLAQTLAEMNWMSAIFSACAITVTGLLILMFGFSSLA